MKIGFDVDGVLANFFEGYERLIISTTGRDLFPSKWPEYQPKVWDWPQTFGYTKEEIDNVWKVIKGNTRFFSTLPALPGVIARHALNESEHDVYFITDRPGLGAQAETQRWLEMHGFSRPSVLISSREHGGKGGLVAGLGLELFVDDKVENILDIQRAAPKCRAYLAPIYPYATNNPLFSFVKRKALSVVEALTMENL